MPVQSKQQAECGGMGEIGRGMCRTEYKAGGMWRHGICRPRENAAAEYKAGGMCRYEINSLQRNASTKNAATE